jgi:periplasmic divalent cation tolerance protein
MTGENWMSKFVQISTTTEKKHDAERISAVLVQKRLAACVQIIGPVKSTYWWENAVKTGEEWICLVKTKKSLIKKVEAEVFAIHPYEVPEFVVTPVLTGSDSYLKWLGSEIQT